MKYQLNAIAIQELCSLAVLTQSVLLKEQIEEYNNRKSRCVPMYSVSEKKLKTFFKYAIDKGRPPTFEEIEIVLS